MLYMKDKLEFFSPTHLQALDFVLLPWPNLHNELYECVNNMQEQFERTSCFKCTVIWILQAIAFTVSADLCSANFNLIIDPR